ncbi:MAG: glycosyltransferase family 4 protein [Cyclobacteriaceae bacterium]
MKNILHVSFSMDTGGGPITIKRIVEDFPKYNHFVVGNEGVFMKGFRHTLRPEKVKNLKGWNLVYNLWLLVRLVKTWNIDVLHLHGRGAASFGRFVRLFRKIKVIYTPNGFFPNSLPWYFRGLYVIGERILLGLTNIVFFVSESEKQTYVKSLRLRPTNPRLVVVQNYLNLERSDYETVLPFTHQTDKKIKFLFIGRLSRQKGVDILLESIKRLTYKDYHLTIIGYGEMEEYLKSEIRKKDLSDNVTFEGKINEAFRLMPHFDALLLPSRFEGLPFTILEAMVYKLPVIGTPCNGSVDLLRGGHGYMSRDVGVKSYLDAIFEFLNDFEKRPAEIAAMVERNHIKLIDCYTLRAVKEKINLIYS